MSEPLQKFIVVQGYSKGEAVFFEPEFFASSHLDLVLMIKIHGLTFFETYKAENQSILKMSLAKLN